jgi:hypothetical protein
VDVDEMTDDESGLGLIEVMVGMFVISLVLMALASTSMASLRSLTGSERLTRANQVGNEVIEDLGAVRFEHLGLYEDEATATFGAVTTFEGEDLVLFPTPATRDDRVPYPEPPPMTRAGTDYAVRTAIVWDTRGAPDSYKRVIVDLTWTVGTETRTARVERLVAPTPEEQPLTVTVTPEVIPLTVTSDGKNAESFAIEAVAIEPQSAVKARWIARDGTTKESSLTGDADNLRWQLPFIANTSRFANGGTLFEVVSTSLDGTRQSTTIGRATFLHTLDINSITVTPSPLVHHPVDGFCSGYELVTDVVGAMLSDPMTIDTDVEDTENTLDALEPVTANVDGAQYRTDYPAEELRMLTARDVVAFELRVERTADLASDVVMVEVPVTRLEPDPTTGEVPPCPVS